MNQPERLQSKESSREQRAGVAPRASALDAHEAKRIEHARARLLKGIEPALSPIMARAIGMRLAHEAQELEAIVARQEKAEKDRQERRETLDARYFKKRRLTRRPGTV